MFPNQWERGITVIESYIAPAIGAMTCSTIRSKTAAMVIVGCMTGVTIGRRSLINPVGVTRRAGQVGMPARQREASVVMIEGSSTPTIGRVTGTAVRAKLAVMPILVGMTGVTILRHTLVNAIGMAGSTDQVGMSSC